jgi:hypothetical protein
MYNEGYIKYGTKLLERLGISLDLSLDQDKILLRIDSVCGLLNLNVFGQFDFRRNQIEDLFYLIENKDELIKDTEEFFKLNKENILKKKYDTKPYTKVKDAIKLLDPSIIIFFKFPYCYRIYDIEIIDDLIQEIDELNITTITSNVFIDFIKDIETSNGIPSVLGIVEWSKLYNELKTKQQREHMLDIASNLKYDSKLFNNFKTSIRLIGKGVFFSLDVETCRKILLNIRDIETKLAENKNTTVGEIINNL